MFFKLWATVFILLFIICMFLGVFGYGVGGGMACFIAAMIFGASAGACVSEA